MKDNMSERLCINLEEFRATFKSHCAQHFDEHSLKKLHHALEVAESAHAGHTRDDDTPYVLHSLRIALFLLQELNIRGADILCAALLHDASEDQERFTPNYLDNVTLATTGDSCQNSPHEHISTDHKTCSTMGATP